MLPVKYFLHVSLLLGVDGSVIVQWAVESSEQDWSPVQHWKHHDHDQQYRNYAADHQPQRRSFEDGHGLAKESVL